ncbi:MAG TPA: ferric reductase-like transmembrane domain-containing protein, partial [Polyangiales bacterium]|nr:ferric reductase-like transmembrane domain-containing protein [Polyangiales bacterium]
LLSAALCVSPFSRWLRESSKLRRALGLAAAGAALFHAEVGLWSGPLNVSEQLDDPQLRFGFGALAVLGLLAVTSFPGAVTALKLRSWKELHRLAYVAWICALLHGLLSPYAWVRGLCAVAVVVLALAPLRLLPRAKRERPNATLDAP